ncbi:MAG: hypothetical protein H7062_22350 [Candidatus Saccharimonas sp.]|nr:hypothetical protein [Planctomycetaceae bacterium]
MNDRISLIGLTAQDFVAIIGPVPHGVIDSIRLTAFSNDTPEEKWTSLLRMLDQTLRKAGVGHLELVLRHSG